MSSSLENRPTRLQRLLHQVLARDLETVTVWTIESVKILKQKEPPSAVEEFYLFCRTTDLTSRSCLQGEMISVVYVKIDF